MDDEISRLKTLYIIFGLGCLSIMIYFTIIKYIFKKKAVYFDPLNKKRFPIPFYGKISGWPMSHITAYAIGVYIYPEYWYHIFFLGVLWEIVEYFFKLLSTRFGSIALADELKFKRTRNDDDEVEYTTWWDSSSQDIIWNSIGIIIGYSMHFLLH